MKFNTKLALTIASCVGTVAVAVIASHDALKADQILNEKKYEPTGEIKHDISEPVKLCWKAYIPTAVVGTVTLGTIVFNHHLTKKEIASISATAMA